MSDKRYEANIIRTTAVEPANNIETTSAPGVWSLDEVMELQKKNKWPTAGNVTTDVDDVFNTFLWPGAGASATAVNNGIDLSTEGGMVWIKSRTNPGSGHFHHLVDSARGQSSGFYKALYSNGTEAENAYPSSNNGGVSSFNSNGFTISAGSNSNHFLNASGYDYVGWTFRKAPKFFDIITYSGNSQTSQTIAHSLGSVPGMMIVKRTDGTGIWWVYHRDVGATKILKLQSTQAEETYSGAWNDTAPTATHFTVGSDSEINYSGRSYVAYLFAHNNNDGEFGPSGDQDIIKCGSFTSDGTDTITLGFEPQWVIVKQTDGSAGWYMWDVMRGWQVGDVGNNQDNYIYANSSNAESDFTVDVGYPTVTGFETKSFGSGDYIYMAIRRGPLAVPTDATKVFAISTYGQGGSSPPSYTSGFAVDMYFEKKIDSSASWFLSSRFTAPQYVKTDSSDAQLADSNLEYDFSDGVYDGSGTNSAYYGWMWKRAPGYFDVVAYTGTGVSGRTVDHNLTVKPDMMLVKSRSANAYWRWYFSPLGATKNFYMPNDEASVTQTAVWNDTEPTSSVFTVGNSTDTNYNGRDYIAYLFATLPGISKVGSYTGTGNSDISVDCGFSSGAKFVLIKRTDAAGSWWVADTARGINTGNDDLLELNATAAELTSYNMVKPLNSGFIVNGGTGKDNSWNDSGGTYVFYAIAT